jgi:cell wall assembly regulator SMI1
VSTIRGEVQGLNSTSLIFAGWRLERLWREGGEADMKGLLRKLEKWLKQYAPGRYRSLLPSATPKELKTCEAALGLRLPDDMRELYRWHNGQGQGGGYFFDIQGPCSFMRLQRVQEVHANLSEILGELEDEEGSGRDTWWHRAWVPFLDNGGDCLCVDTRGALGGVAGQVVYFAHDDSARSIECPSLEKWLGTFVAGLEAGLWREQGNALELLDKQRFEQLHQQMSPGYPVVVHSRL